MTFRRWLARHVKEPTPLGDLARDVQRDGCWPPYARRLDVLRDHILDHDCCEDALVVLEVAWELWQEETKRMPPARGTGNSGVNASTPESL